MTFNQRAEGGYPVQDSGTVAVVEFATFAEFAAANTSRGWVDGQIASADGVFYLRSPTSTLIDGLPGWALLAGSDNEYIADLPAAVAATAADRVQTGIDAATASGAALEASASETSSRLNALSAANSAASASASAIAAASAEAGADDAADIAEAAAAAAAASAEFAAIAAGAPIVTTLTSPTPANGTIELLKVDAGMIVYEVTGGAWVMVGWLQGPDFPTVADLLASTATSLGDIGDIVNAGGFRYQIVTTGEHLTTAGGVKLYVLPQVNGYNVRAAGALGNGSADDIAPIAKMVATGGAVYFPEGTYVSDSILAASDGQSFSGDGPGMSSIVFKTGETGYLLSSNGNQIHVLNLRLFGGDDSGKTTVGDVEPTSGASDDRSGLNYDADLDTTIHNVVIHGFGNRGLAVRPSSDVNRHGGVAISNVHCYNNWCNFEAGPSVSEYLRVANSTFNGGQIGVRTSSGNQAFANCIISDNYCNVDLVGTTVPNNSHGSMVGCLINHGTVWAIRAVDVTNGFSFVACNMFYGAYELIDSYGIIFSNGIFDVTTFSVSGGGRNYVNDNYCDDALANTYNPSSGGTIVFSRNFRADGTFVLNNEMVKMGSTYYIVGNQPVAHFGESGAMENFGLRLLSDGGTGVFQLRAYTSGALVAQPSLSINRANGDIGFFGATPVARQSVSAAATDAATTQTLVNSLRAALINLGFAV